MNTLTETERRQKKINDARILNQLAGSTLSPFLMPVIFWKTAQLNGGNVVAPEVPAPPVVGQNRIQIQK